MAQAEKQVATLTRGQKAAQRRAEEQALREAEQKRKEAEIQARVDAALNTTAGKMLLLLAGFSEFSDHLSVNLTAGAHGPELKMQTEYARGGYYNDKFWFGNLTLASQDHEFEEVQGYLDQLRAERAEQRRLRQVAQDTYDSLTEDQRNALGLTRRP